MSATKQLEDAVFYTALNVADLVQRKLFLDQSCAGNPGLRAVVEEMLSAQNDADHFFVKGRAALFLTADELPAAESSEEKIILDEQIGTHIGRYKLLQKIGEGGCGVVYMAEQEKPVRRRVALKVIKLGMDTKSVIARFEAERQALALMDHPNIARVLDAGATDTGRPYFVMELVHGTKVSDYCDENQLDTRARLQLFTEICHAIQHAHQKGIIHRDIKPSNVMVTLHDGVPVPKVIDFGIAKATEGRLTDSTIFTAYEQFIGTPAYMSPEQAERSGLDIDTRSDIYSLGVLLYELLTGRTPFDGKKMAESGIEQMRQTLRETEPQMPSAMINTLQDEELTKTAINRHVEPPKLVFMLRGDLDWIVMRTLEKDRTRRYQTANGLAMDVQRYLDSEPITARPPSQLYRFQKLVRRNKIVFGAVVAVVVALLIGLGTSTWLFFREREALREEARLREQSEAREKINQAAVYVSQGKYEDAAKLLDEIKTPPPRPSFDGVSAYRWVGDWLAVEGRWQDAADRFSALMEIDKLDDVNQVTLDYQSCGIVLAESGDVDRYRQFCSKAVADFSMPPNGNAGWRILKVCLLLPPDKQLIATLSPLAKVSEKSFDLTARRTGAGDSWGSIPIALWNYRCGDYRTAAKVCEVCLAGKDQLTVQGTTDRIILAMSDWQLGQSEQAQSELSQGREVIEAKFKSDLGRGNKNNGFWWDWVFARILMREAMALIENNSAPAGSNQSIKQP
jgi:serine/threonine protein kinase